MKNTKFLLLIFIINTLILSRMNSYETSLANKLTELRKSLNTHPSGPLLSNAIDHLQNIIGKQIIPSNCTKKKAIELLNRAMEQNEENVI